MEDCLSNWFLKSSSTDISVEQSLRHCADSCPIAPTSGSLSTLPSLLWALELVLLSCTNETPGFSGFRLGLTNERRLWQTGGPAERKSRVFLPSSSLFGQQGPDIAWCLHSLSTCPSPLGSLLLGLQYPISTPCPSGIPISSAGLSGTLLPAAILTNTDIVWTLQRGLHWPPEKFSDQLHQERSHESTDGEYGHGHRPEQSQSVRVYGMSTPSFPWLVVKGLDVLETNNKPCYSSQLLEAHLYINKMSFMEHWFHIRHFTKLSLSSVSFNPSNKLCGWTLFLHPFAGRETEAPRDKLTCSAEWQTWESNSDLTLNQGEPHNRITSEMCLKCSYIKKGKICHLGVGKDSIHTQKKTTKEKQNAHLDFLRLRVFCSSEGIMKIGKTSHQLS